MKKRLLDVIGTILLFIGFVLAFLPHAFHAKIGLNDNITHIKHVIYGIGLILISLTILVWNNKALNILKQ